MAMETHTGARWSWEELSGRVDGDPMVEVVYDHVLSNPSMIGRLVQIASYWDPESDAYDNGLPPEFQAQNVSEALRRLHEFVFLNWLGLSLASQRADVAIYLGGVGRPLARLRKLRTMGSRFVPMSAGTAERELFLEDLSIVEALLDNRL